MSNIAAKHSIDLAAVRDLRHKFLAA